MNTISFNNNPFGLPEIENLAVREGSQQSESSPSLESGIATLRRSSVLAPSPLILQACQRLSKPEVEEYGMPVIRNVLFYTSQQKRGVRVSTPLGEMSSGDEQIYIEAEKTKCLYLLNFLTRKIEALRKQFQGGHLEEQLGQAQRILSSFTLECSHHLRLFQFLEILDNVKRFLIKNLYGMQDEAVTPLLEALRFAPKPALFSHLPKIIKNLQGGIQFLNGTEKEPLLTMVYKLIKSEEYALATFFCKKFEGTTEEEKAQYYTALQKECVEKELPWHQTGIFLENMSQEKGENFSKIDWNVPRETPEELQRLSENVEKASQEIPSIINNSYAKMNELFCRCAFTPEKVPAEAQKISSETYEALKIPSEIGIQSHVRKILILLAQKRIQEAREESGKEVYLFDNSRAMTAVQKAYCADGNLQDAYTFAVDAFHARVDRRMRHGEPIQILIKRLIQCGASFFSAALEDKTYKSVTSPTITRILEAGDAKAFCLLGKSSLGLLTEEQMAEVIAPTYFMAGDFKGGVDILSCCLRYIVEKPDSVSRTLRIFSHSVHENIAHIDGKELDLLFQFLHTLFSKVEERHILCSRREERKQGSLLPFGEVFQNFHGEMETLHEKILQSTLGTQRASPQEIHTFFTACSRDLADIVTDFSPPKKGSYVSFEEPPFQE